MPSRRTKRRNAQQASGLSGGAVFRSYFRMVDQLTILRRRVNERVPLFREAMQSVDSTWSAQSAELRLDFETYVMVLARFFRLCRTITGQPGFGDELIVRQIRDMRNLIVEHGLDDASGQGDRGFFCGDEGPQLVTESGIPCLSMNQLDQGVGELMDRYELRKDQIALSHFSPFGPQSSIDKDELLRAILDN